MSDWGLGRKLNSQIEGVPLNHLIWLQDYKTYGEDSYVFRNKDILHELYLSTCALNDRTIGTDALNYAISQNKMGVALNKIYGLEKTIDWSNINTLEDLVANTDALVQVCSNSITLPILNGYFAESEVAMNAICNSKDALLMLWNDYGGMGKIFSESPHLTSAATSSLLYEVTTNEDAIALSNANARRIHYANKCFILGMSQVCGNSTNPSIRSYVDTLNGVMSQTTNLTYSGSNPLIWRIDKFASAAKCQPLYRDITGQVSGASYMAILKIE